jgi:hypothetical protein
LDRFLSLVNEVDSRMSSRSLPFRAGAASVCITPDEPLWLAGYAVRAAPARGKISDLFASALALEDATGNRFVLASADLIGITPIIADAVIEAAQSRHGLSRRQILLAATHTHYGPEFRPDKQVFFNIPEEYAAKLPAVAARLASSINDAIDQAIARLEPVRLFARQTTAGFAHNRRRRGVKHGTPSTEDVVDHEVPVVDCVNESGRRKAIVFGYACHNTTIPPDDLRYCADWAGFARERIERANPGAIALFLPGAGADQDPEPSGSVEISRQHGNELADTIQRSLDGPGAELTGPILAGLEDVMLDLAPVTRAQLQAMLKSDDSPQRVKAKFLLDQLACGNTLIASYPAPIQVVRLGDGLIIIALSGEPVVDWAHKLKQRATEKEPGVKHGSKATPPDSMLHAPSSTLIWVAGYCNDMYGYLPTRRVQSEGGYEGGRANLWSWIPAPFTDEVEDKITDAVIRLVQRVSQSATTNS